MAAVLAPLLFGVPVALGIAVSLIRLLALRYPDLGWATTVNSDAEELYLGHTLYQNPAHGYTGQIYTPLFPAIVSVFDHVFLWNGWALVVVILASVSLVILVARVGYARTAGTPRVVSVLGAGGIGCIAYWCVSSVKLPVLDEARADQFAWALALFGLIAVADFGPRPSRRRVVGAVMLLSAALWAKQTTVAVVAPATAWVLALALRSCLDRRAAVLFTALLCGVNLLLLAVLNLLTNGWEFFINFELATRQSDEFSYHANFIKGLQCTALAGGFVLACWLASVVRAGLRARRSERVRAGAHAERARLRRLLVAPDPTGRRMLLLVAYVVFGFALALYFMRKQGTETNQLIGVVWALGLLAAGGWRLAQRRAGSAAVAGGCVAALFVLVQLQPVRSAAASADVSIPALEAAEQWQSVPPELLAYARDHTLYTPLYADLNVPDGGPLYPNYYNFADLLAGGEQPLYLVHALLDRRFDAVAYFSLEGNGYTSANGKWEENYLWKLDEVIAARYMESPLLPQGLLVRRPGPERAAWMRDCFGPFAASGASFRIHRGGGFWCSFAADELQLVRTPAPLSEVVTTRAVRPRGAIEVSLEHAHPGRVELELDGGGGARWAVQVTPAPGRPDALTVATYERGTMLGRASLGASVLPGGRLGVRLALAPTDGQLEAPVGHGAGTVAVQVPASAAPFAVVASTGAGLDLRSLWLAR